MSILASTILQVSLMATAGQSYDDAHKVHLETGRPLVVLVGAEWCPACRTMKQATIPQAQQQGVLSGVAFAQVNTDQQPDLARKLMRGGAIPQLIVYHKSAAGWRRRELLGAQSVSAIARLVRPPQAAATAVPATARIGR
jgi:thioredoxin-like negative regulator of GroEL